MKPHLLCLLLAMPYIVDVSTQELVVFPDSSVMPMMNFIHYPSVSKKIVKEHRLATFSCQGSATDCEWLYDLAEALNMAHESRTAVEIFFSSVTVGPSSFSQKGLHAEPMYFPPCSCDHCPRYTLEEVK